jgi:hypothetical protein
MLFKTTKKLFKNQYQYKLVITCAGASWFRGGDWDSVLDQLKKVTITQDGPLKGKITAHYPTWRTGIKTQEDLDYGFKLHKVLSKMTDIEVRVESPWITVYTNSKSNVDALVKIDASKIKYVCSPPSVPLEEDTIIMPKVNFDYRITLGKTTQNHSAFIGWAEQNKKLKLTNSCKRELARNMSWGGTHFYVSGDNNLLMVKMHLGGSINKVERIIKA